MYKKDNADVVRRLWNSCYACWNSATIGSAPAPISWSPPQITRSWPTFGRRVVTGWSGGDSCRSGRCRCVGLI